MDLKEAIDLSIIIISYNTKSMLINCLRSVYNYINDIIFEVIIVDNASSDGSPQAVKQYFPCAILIENDKNLGFAKANNQAFRIARGKAIFMLNSDTLLTSNGFRGLLDYFWLDKRIGIIAPKLLNRDGSIQNSCKKLCFLSFRINYEPPPAMMKVIPDFLVKFLNFHNLHKKQEIRDIDYAIGAALLVKKEVFDKIGFLDENFFFSGEEADFCKRTWESGYKIIYYPFYSLYHLRGQSSKSNSINRFVLDVRYQAQYYYLKKHHSHIEYRIYWLRQLIQAAIKFSFYTLIANKEKKETNRYIITKHLKDYKIAI